MPRAALKLNDAVNKRDDVEPDTHIAACGIETPSLGNGF